MENEILNYLLEQLLAWLDGDTAKTVNVALMLCAAAKLLDIFLPNDSWIVRKTRWLVGNILQARPNAPQQAFTSLARHAPRNLMRAISGLL